MHPQLRFNFFGAFQVTKNGAPLTGFRSEKTRALLAWLALEADQPARRREIVRLLWDGYDQNTARASLRSALSNLRQLLQPLDLLATTYHTVQMRVTNTDVSSDLQALEELLSNEMLAQSQTALQEALGLYQGEFLADLDGIDSPPFQAWLQAKRKQYHELFAEVAANVTNVPLNPTPHNLSPARTPLFGRTEELESLSTRILSEDYPLITLVGEGGIGKTRLAQALAEKVQPYFADGVWFVSLAALQPGPDLHDQLALAIANELGLRFAGESAYAKQLFRLLLGKRVLIILDNFEHLLAGADFVLELLKSRYLKILVTSQQRLNLYPEYVFRVPPLPLPPIEPVEPETIAHLRTYPSVQLFADRAERQTSTFELTPLNQSSVTRICQLADGLPLTIELAAGLLETQSCETVAATLSVDYAGLSTAFIDMPPRQRSIRAALEYSWRLLSERETHLLVCCSIFRDTFSAEAACFVCGGAASAAENQSLAEATAETLADKSLLQRTVGGRYRMLDTVHKYAGHRLRQDPSMLQTARTHYMDYYAAFIRTHNDKVRTLAAQERQYPVEMDNIYAAWQMAVDEGRISQYALLAEPLYDMYEMTGRYIEAEALFARGAEALFHAMADDPNPPAPTQYLWGLLSIMRAHFMIKLGCLQDAQALLEEVLEFGHTLENEVIIAGVLVHLATIAWVRDDHDAFLATVAQYESWSDEISHSRLKVYALQQIAKAKQMRKQLPDALATLQRAREIARRECDSPDIQADILIDHGWCYEAAGQLSQSAVQYNAALRLYRQADRQIGIGIALYHLACVQMRMGKFAGTLAKLKTALAIFRCSGHTQYEGKVLIALSCNQLQKRELVMARTYSEQAVALLRRSEYRQVYGHALACLGDVLSALGDLELAVKTYQQTFANLAKTGQPRLHLIRTAGDSNQCFTQTMRNASVDKRHLPSTAPRAIPALLIPTGDCAEQSSPSLHKFLTRYQLCDIISDAQAEAALRYAGLLIVHNNASAYGIQSGH